MRAVHGRTIGDIGEETKLAFAFTNSSNVVASSASLGAQLPLH